MPPRATLEEISSDDEDLPLVRRSLAPLQGTGTQGAILQEITEITDYSEGFADPPMAPMPSRPSNSNSGGAASGARPTAGGDSGGPGVHMITDNTPYKKWTTIYPLYLDAKRPFTPTQRRIPHAKAVWWPTSLDISEATRVLRIPALHENGKCHPRDWENPGRVRVLWKEGGKIVWKGARTKKELIEKIAAAIQAAKPELKPPPLSSTLHKPPPHPTLTTSNTPVTTTTTASKKKPVPTKSTSTSKTEKKERERKPKNAHLIPPEPHPPISSRLSAYSPAIETGMLVEAVKAGMNALAGPGAGGGPGGEGAGGMGGAGGAKGKRKVLRVRG
ncbi:signal recognition particle, SRP19 subunit, partial [Sistotremastrum niveocremeum HHB9708]